MLTGCLGTIHVTQNFLGVFKGAPIKSGPKAPTDLNAALFAIEVFQIPNFCIPLDHIQRCRSTEAKGAAHPLPSKSGGKGGKCALLLLSTDLTFSHFLLTFVLLSGLISFYPQDFISCHEIQQWLGAYVCEK